MMVKPDSSSLCVPRWATARNPARETTGAAIGEIARTLGQPLMPWQQLVADVGGEILPDGRPAYRAVVFTVPRQSGKTTLILAWEVQRALGWASTLGRPQRIAYSAQTAQDAREKLMVDQWPMLVTHQRVLGIDRPIRSNGSEAIIWKNGSRIVLLASTEESGHGKTLDLGVKDELFADSDMRRDQALEPAMVTRPHAQILTASTMGTSDAIALNLEVQNGRAAVEAGKDSGIAYFEWSADPDDDPGNPQTWARCMPALGHTISPDVIGNVFDRWQGDKLDDFRRAYLNIPTVSDMSVIPYAAWRAVCDENVTVAEDMFAVDVSVDRSAAAIVAVGNGPALEVVDYRPGTAWLVARIVELHEKYRCRFALEKNGPVANFTEDLDRHDIPYVALTAEDLRHACGAFYDAVVDQKVKIRTNNDLDAAVAAAAKRPIGDAWVWGRKPSRGDISLLVAATVGMWAQMTHHEMIPMIAAT